MLKKNMQVTIVKIYVFDRPAMAVSAFVVAAGPIVAAHESYLARP